jgi:hypothetical protein
VTRSSRRGRSRRCRAARRARVKAPHGGIVVEWLVEEGDPVAPASPWSACTRRRPAMTRSLRRPAATYAGSSASARYRPARVVPNSEILEQIDSSDEWIQTRSGIKERRWADGRDRADDVGHAAKDALGRAGIDPAADRLRHRRHRHAPATRRRRSRPGSRSSSGHRRGRLRHLARLRGLLLRRRDGHDWSAAAARSTCWRSASSGSSDITDRRTAVRRSSSPTAPARRRRPADEPGSARSSGAPTATQHRSSARGVWPEALGSRDCRT